MGILTGNNTGNPYWNLPLTDPRCMNASCYAFIIGYNESQERYPNHLFENYGFWTVYFYATILGIFTFIHVRHRVANLDDRYRFRERAVGSWRSFTYRRLYGRIGDQLDVSYGILVLLSAATIFLFVMPFHEGFFLREEFRFGSPPLSVRCAMLMSALTPIMIALAGKMNLVTLMTGISYAKLNIWHRFIGYAVFVLAWVHTIPHLVAPIKEGGIAELTHLFAIHRREFSGTFLIFVFTCLVVFSLPCCRSKAYEWFKHAHIALALAWFTLIFWHIRNEYVAPEFFYSAAGIWLCSVVARVVHRNRFLFPLSTALRGFPTTLEHLSGNMTRVTVFVPKQMRWKPGQHCYISVPGISSLGNHPFTIASVPHPRIHQGPNELVLLIRECGGFTKLLGTHARNHHANMQSSLSLALQSPPAVYMRNERGASMISMLTIREKTRSSPQVVQSASDMEVPRPASRASNLKNSISFSVSPHGRHSSHASPSASGLSTRKGSATSIPDLENLATQQREHAQVSAWIDGPFGEYARPLHRHYEGFITVSGGSGLSASLPWMVYLTEKMRIDATASQPDRGAGCKIRSVKFIWSIRKSEWISWARTEIIQALRAAAASAGRLDVLIYITSRDADEVVGKSAQLDLMIAAGVAENNDRAAVEVRFGRPNMEETLPGLLEKKRNMVRVCGPNALKSSVANAVANMQRLVVAGEVESIALDSETFGW